MDEKIRYDIFMSKVGNDVDNIHKIDLHTKKTLHILDRHFNTIIKVCIYRVIGGAKNIILN